MKDLCVSLALLMAISMSTQGTYAAWDGMQSLNPMPYISYLNPLPYVGIGENKTNFSLNPLKGFKNCDKCKVQKTACHTCDRVKTSPSCYKIYPKCTSCHDYIIPARPRCASCGQ